MHHQTTGAGQLIPLAAETSRVEWTDIWDRPWSQPVRSTFVDAAPIPGPLRNFQMTTTYELLDPTTGDRTLQWQSDQDLVVRAQVKVLNNYEKWFEHTDCEANQVMQLGKTFSPVVYGDTTVDNEVTNLTSKTQVPCWPQRLMLVRVGPNSYSFPPLLQWISYGHKSGYGVCLQDGTVTLSGVSVSTAQRQSIEDVQICSESKPYVPHHHQQHHRSHVRFLARQAQPVQEPDAGPSDPEGTARIGHVADRQRVELRHAAGRPLARRLHSRGHVGLHPHRLLGFPVRQGLPVAF